MGGLEIGEMEGWVVGGREKGEGRSRGWERGRWGRGGVGVGGGWTEGGGSAC